MYSLNFMAHIIKDKKNMLNESVLQPNTNTAAEKTEGIPKI
jgi:uncharacterized protein YfkK (UPF0435 family)